MALRLHASIAPLYPCLRLVERGYVRIDGLKAMSMNDGAHFNELLDSVLTMEMERERAK